MGDNLSEFPILLCCAWAGALLGIVYEALRLLRLSGKRPAVFAADLLFSVCFFAVASAVLFYADHGRLRPHYFAAIFASMLLWICFPGRLIRQTLAALRGRLAARRGERRR